MLPDFSKPPKQDFRIIRHSLTFLEGVVTSFLILIWFGCIVALMHIFFGSFS